MNDLKEIGGFIVSADPFVQHDNSLSGNGTVNSPLGVNTELVNSGTFNINTNIFSGTSYVNWYEYSNGMCRLKGSLRPNPSNQPNNWNAVEFASGGPSACFESEQIPCCVDWYGYVNYIEWKDNGRLTFCCREQKLSAANMLVYFNWYGVNRKQ